MPSRRLADLHPALQLPAEQFLGDCADAGYDVLVTCTYRSNAEQAAAYAQGRTVPGKIVTNAKPGQSLHNTTLHGKPAAQALDVVPLRFGKPVWDSKDPAWQAIGKIGEANGFEWAGRWKRMREFPHFQMRIEA